MYDAEVIATRGLVQIIRTALELRNALQFEVIRRLDVNLSPDLHDFNSTRTFRAR